MFKFNRRKITPKKAFLIAYDLVATIVAAIAASMIVFNGRFLIYQRNIIKDTWFFLIIASAITFYLMGFYDQMWAFARGIQYYVLPAGTALQLFVSVLVMQIMHKTFSLSTYVIYWFLLTFAVLAIRIIYRFLFLAKTKSQDKRETGTIRVLVVGAGAAGTQIITELKSTQKKRVAVCAVDDNVLTHNYKNNGVPVLGSCADIPDLVKAHNIDEIIIAIPSASSETLRDILNICNKTKCDIRILPFLSQIEENAKVSLANLRKIRIEDLLGREPVDLNNEQVRSYLNNKVVLVTGAGGSIGSELTRQIANYAPSLLILFDIYENNVYDLQQELIAKYGDALNMQVLIGSVRDVERLEYIFDKWKPQVVFHAAAHKHVPLMEFSPCEAVKNNVYGTYNVASMSGRKGVEKFVLISTDKAVNPTNVMGATKRLCEIIAMTMHKVFPNTVYAAVRFGNVLGSNGSVIPLFEKQIREQHKVTVTHPDIKRYFMTIPEAASLVLQTSVFAKDGEIFILDMDKPVKIVNLARDMIRLNGLVPDVDVKIEYIGLRPGEKMEEELFLNKEEARKTANKKIFTLHQTNDVNYLESELQKLESIIRCKEIGLAEFMERIMAIVKLNASGKDVSGAVDKLPPNTRMQFYDYDGHTFIR